MTASVQTMGGFIKSRKSKSPTPLLHYQIAFRNSFLVSCEFSISVNQFAD
jgi:hypothetical protein